MDPSVHTELVAGTACANCGAALHGPFCSQCGQHAHGSARTMGVLLHDTWHVVTHSDSRFWKTLIALLCFPGRLTVEYLEDHRERYLPPVRLYLILSVIFFAATSLGVLHYDPSKVKLNTTQSAEVAKAAAEGRAQGRAACEQIDARDSATAARLKAGCLATLDRATAGHETSPEALCQTNLASGYWHEAIINGCQRVAHDHGASLVQTFQHNLPRMMFVLLPLMAAFMLLLYWHPHRLYVEHLVFLLHLQAATYLIFTLQLLLQGLAEHLPVLASLSSVTGMIVGVYVCWYCFRALRRTYGQGRGRTALKLAVIATLYFVCLALGAVATLAYSFLESA